jgi:predicted deacylase
MLVYEGGENLRLDKFATQEGLNGLRRLLFSQGMLSPGEATQVSLHYEKTSWIRSPKAGMFRFEKKSGDAVKRGDRLGQIFDPYGQEQQVITAKRSGHIIGHSNMPVVSQGDALFHLAYDLLP